MSSSYFRASMVGLLAFLICLFSVGQPAHGDTIEIVDTGLTGTTGDDDITNSTPLTPDATHTITDIDLYDPLTTRATGIDGREGDDEITNDAIVTSTSNATVDIPLKYSRTESTAESTGITGGSGDDVVTNGSVLRALAEGRSVVTEFLLQIDVGVTGWPTESTATTVGMDGGADLDTVTNAAVLEARSTAYSQANKIRFDAVNVPADALGLGDASTTATATATGLAAGAEAPAAMLHGLETVRNTGFVTVNADATATTQEASVELIGAARIDDQTSATASATGIEGSGRDNLIANTGSLDVDAVSYAELLSGELKMSGLMLKGGLDLFGVDVGQMNTAATAEAKGIAGGDGDDTIRNLSPASNIDVYAEGTALTVEATLSVNPGLSGGGGTTAATSASLALSSAPDGNATETGDLSYGDADTTAVANAVGIAAGDGDDTVESTGQVTAEGSAAATSVGVNVDASFSSGAMAYFPLPGAAIVDAKTDSQATAVGFDGGAGTDTLTNGGTLNAIAGADAETVTVGLAVKGVTKGFAAGVTVGDSSSYATATATGMTGGGGNDTLTNSGTLLASSTATDDTTTVDVSVAVSTEGLVGGVTVADSSAHATAVSTGMSGGTGGDTIVNGDGANLTSYAEADADAVTVGVSVAGTKVGVVTGVTVADASSIGAATATGIAAQSGGNTITNMGSLDATAIAHDDSSSISVTVAGEKAGIVAGVALADATATSTATSVGIDALDPDLERHAAGDVIYTSGGVTATSTATATDVAVAATLNAALQGVVGGGAAVEGDGTANAYATGVRSGAGGDRVTSAGDGGITATSTATTASTNVAVTMNAAWEGVALGAAVADTTTKATAEAEGIATGGGADTVTNAATLTSTATASASSDTVAVTVAVAPKGISAGFAMSTSETQSEATAEGINSGEGDDTITNTALVDVDAIATTSTDTITINFAEVGAAIADVSSAATATATGIDMGAGGDELRNSAAVSATATATSDDTAGTANFAGYAAGDVTSTATATAVGVRNAADVGNARAIDIISNDSDGSITASAHADVDAENYVVQGGGAAIADTGVQSHSTAVGIAGDVGAEHVTNSGLVDVTAETDADATSFDFELIGVQLGSAGVNATGTAVGLDASGGRNEIHNTSTGTIRAYSNVDTLAGSVTGGFGANVAVSGVTADARSAGIWTEDDNDWIVNAGLVDVTGAAYGNAGAGSIGLFSLTMAYSLGSVTLDGIRAGGGDDRIENTGWLNVGQLRAGDTALVKADSEAVSLDLFGLVTSGLSARGTVTGIDGGSGEDTIVNTGILTVGDDDQWMAVGEALGESGQIIGWNSAHAGSTASMTATGIHGGLDLDTIFNDEDGMITVDARSYAEVETTAYLTLGFLGGITAKSSSYANAYATGIAGGGGDDLLGNAGGVLARATSYAYSDSYSHITLDFAAEADAVSNGDSTAVATGIDAGSGTNTVENTGSVTAQANAYVRGTGDSDATFEDTKTEMNIRSEARATGVAGGNDGNRVFNSADGHITAAATAATTDPSGNGSSAYSDHVVTARIGTQDDPVHADATGIGTGAGDDAVRNDGAITVTSDSSATVYANTHVWYRYPTSTATGVAVGDATGINAGAGDNVVINNGALAVTATSNAVPSVDSWSRDYRATANTTAYSTATATGITADGTIVNTEDGEMFVIARAISNARADTRAENVTAEATLDAHAIGMTVATDAAVDTPHQLRNDGGMTVLATAGEDASGNVHESLYIDTDVWVRSDNGTGDAELTADAAGVRVHDAPTEITNTGDLLVQARARPYARSFVDSRDYNPRATVEATGWAYARGIHATDGEHTITNTGTMDVRAVVQDAYTQADTWSSWSTCYSTATTNGHAMAAGIETAGGDDTILNGGTLTVIADADVVSYAWADTRDNNLADEYENTYATATARAIGIDGGDGANTIVNTGLLDVYAVATPLARYGGGHAHVTATETAVAEATGIRVGDGGSLIHNTGEITVHSGAEARTSTTIASVGIAGGLGADTIINEGTIAAWIYGSPNALRASLPAEPTPDVVQAVWPEVDGASALQVAATTDMGIAAGGGNDTVWLDAGSMVWGAIDLGDDDDTLKVIQDAGVSGDITAGAGDDWLLLEGEGGLPGAVSAFEHVAKDGEGVFTLSHLDPTRHIEVNAGCLHLEHDYQLMDDGVYHTHINPRGTCGLLHSEGTLELDGTMEVVRDSGAFRTDSSYDVLLGSDVTGAFDTVQLPRNSPLLRYSMEQGTDRCSVHVDMRRFKTVVTNDVEWDVARYLDLILPTIKGDAYLMLGEFQRLGTSADFRRAFTSLSPHAYAAGAQVTHEVLRQYTDAVTDRMDDVRNATLAMRGEWDALPDRVMVASAAGDEGVVRTLVPGETAAGAYKPYGIWASGFGQWGEQDGDHGFAGYDYDTSGVAVGGDYALSDRLIVGASFDSAETEIDLDRDAGTGDIEAIGGSLYATYFTDRWYVDGTLAYAHQDYDTRRPVVIGPIQAMARSDHDGDAMSALFGGGYHVPVRNWVVGPFGTLQYVRLDEDGFTETGAGGVGLRIEDRTTDSLRSELGARAAGLYEYERGSLIPEVRAAWTHDYDIDDRDITASLAGAGGAAFTLTGQDLEENGAILGAGLTYLHGNGVRATLRYDAELRSDYNAHGVFGEIRVPF